MKPKIFLLSLLFCAACKTTFAQKTKAAMPVTTAVHLTEAARTLSVENDVTVVLTDSKTDDIIVEGDAHDVKELRVKMNEGALSVYASSERNMAAVKVYVPAAQLDRIHLWGKSVLRTATTLQNPRLRIIVEGEGIVSVSSTGKVVVEVADGYDFTKSK